MLRRVIEGPYRVGPWPGLSASGGVVLLACAALIAASEALVGSRVLPVLGVSALLPMALATRIVNTPGAAAAVCGAYLLPRTLLTLAKPDIVLPPLLLVPAFAFDIALWLRWSDLKRARRKQRVLRVVTRRRAAFGGALFGVVLCAVQPTFELLPSLVTVAACTVAGLVSVRGTAE